ncbi:unnamed protein product [Allacma fusca]|uniref:Tim10-like domain-containing protein n=1 Tax=Allacma fusca TaxID=39272 RepID=A0A8J2LDK5_9HEXA|nr:unnamed protein product [Allacma fusca]
MDSGELIQLKEFLLLFNKLSDRCFRRCVYTLGSATLTGEERNCIDTCLSKNVNFNQKTLALFMEINPPFQQKKMEEQMAQVEELRRSQAAAVEASPQPVPIESQPVQA